MVYDEVIARTLININSIINRFSRIMVCSGRGHLAFADPNAMLRTHDRHMRFV